MLKVEPEQSMQKKNRMAKSENIDQKPVPESESMIILREKKERVYNIQCTIMRCKLNINCEFYKNTP